MIHLMNDVTSHTPCDIWIFAILTVFDERVNLDNNTDRELNTRVSRPPCEKRAGCGGDPTMISTLFSRDGGGRIEITVSFCILAFSFVESLLSSRHCPFQLPVPV